MDDQRPFGDPESSSNEMDVVDVEILLSWFFETTSPDDWWNQPSELDDDVVAMFPRRDDWPNAA